MKPFDLEKLLADYPVVTRDGEWVESTLELLVADDPVPVNSKMAREMIDVYFKTGLTPRQLLDRLNQLTGESK